MGNWVDLTVVGLLVFGLIRGFVRGFVRELFGIVGVIVALAAAFRGYQGLAEYMLVQYPLPPWQAQVIAFGLIALGVGLAAALITQIGIRIIRITPFAFIDRLAGAVFGGAKVLVVLMVVISLIASLGIPVVQEQLTQSHLISQLLLLRPLVFQYLEKYWPETWDKPPWLFPNPGLPAGY